MRTTLTLEDDVLRRAKNKAAEENRPLKEIINEALRRGLESGARKTSRPFKFRLKTVPGKRQPGVDLTDRDRLFDLMGGR